MDIAKRLLKWKHAVYVPLVLAAVITGRQYFLPGPTRPQVQAEEAPRSAESPPAVHVEFVHPQLGEMDRTSTQPGSVQAYESVRLYSEVSGFLKKLSVDIGDRVKQGQVLAAIDVPELEKQVQRNAALLVQAKTKVDQMKARLDSAVADQEAAEAAVVQAEANAKSKTAALRFREQQYGRYKQLAVLKSIDERMVDEKFSERDAAQEAYHAAVAAITTTKANVKAAAAKITQARADIAAAEAEVQVARAELEKSQVLVRFGTITAPFDGVIAQRGVFPGDFVQAANSGGVNHPPLLTVQRTDLLRVVIQVPDRDVPYANPGDPAVVEVDALPGEKFPGTISRIANSEDASTRLMRVEIDLPNQTGRICSGMYGRVKLVLEKSKLLAVPSTCIVSRTQTGNGTVYVVRGDRVQLQPVALADDNGHNVGIISGLRAEDNVVIHPSGSLRDDLRVAASPAEEHAQAGHGH